MIYIIFQKNQINNLSAVYRIPTSETDSKSEPITTADEVKIIKADELPESDKLNNKKADARLSNVINTSKSNDFAIARSHPQSDISTEEVAAIEIKEIKNSTCASRLICSEPRSVLRELSSNEVRISQMIEKLK